MAAELAQLAARLHVLVATDNAFQRKARVLQALWRERMGLLIGSHRGRPLGSRIAMPAAREGLLNYINDTIRDVVRSEVLDPQRSKHKLYGKPRIFDDLLSSQPLCFNLFGELQCDLALATRVFRALTGGRVDEVTAIAFEHSPGRGDAKYTGDRSAFDVFVEYAANDAKGFLGIEVKYHESLADKPGRHRPRYDEIADAAGIFAPACREALRCKPLQQVWRDHLLSHSLLLAGDYAEGCFVFLAPRDNERCSRAIAQYLACLTDDATFAAWSLEDVVAAARAAGGGSWVDAFEERYLAFDKLES